MSSPKVPMTQGDERDDLARVRPRKWRPRFLEALALKPDVTLACECAGISRQTAYRNRHEDPEFAAQWEAAMLKAVDDLEAEAFKRAYESKSDQVLLALLAAWRPERYRPTVRQELAGVRGQPIERVDVLERLADDHESAIAEVLRDELERRRGRA